MNFTDLTQTEITLYGNSSNQTLTCPVPPCLQQNLLRKRVGVESLLMTTQNLPRFVPKPADDLDRSYTGGSTGTDSYINRTDFDPAVLGYYIVIRKSDNTKAVTSYVQWSNPNDIQKPSIGIVNAQSVYMLPYFYCYNFMDFLKMVREAIVAGLESAMGTSLTAPVTFLYDAKANTFNLSVPKYTQPEWQIELSASLMELFNFQFKPVTYGTFPTGRIDFLQLSYTSEGYTFNYATCKVNNSIFPFDLFILDTNLPVNNVNFVSSIDLPYSFDQNMTVLKMWRKDFDAIHFDTTYSFQNQNVANSLKTFIRNELNNDKLNFRLYVRTRREQMYILWTLQQNDKIEMTLDTYSLF